MQLDSIQYDPTLLGSSSGSAKAPRARRGKVSSLDVANLTAQLAIMVHSGVDIASALESVARQCKRPMLGEVLREIHESVIGGSVFSDALRQFPHVFDPAYVATVAAGEASGHMAEVLNQLAELKRSQLRLARTIRGMLVYPALLMGVSAMVIGVLLVFVLPKFAQLFADYDMALPWITQVLIAVAAEIRTRWWLWAPLAGAGVAAAVALATTKKGRRIIDLILLRAPMVDEVSRTLLIGRSCRLIGMMMNSGVPLLDSVRLARQTTKNYLYQQLFSDIEDAVVNGRSFASTLASSTIVPQAAAEMLSTAEQSGKLADVSLLIGTYFEEEGESKARQMVTALEPMITVVMGAIVATVVLAVMLPVFDLSSFAGGG